MSGWDKRRKAIAAAPVALLVIGLFAWAFWPEPTEPAPRERQYKATTACLLTDDKGLTSDPARSVWAGMQDASLATHIKVQHLAVTGPQTAANALTYVNTLGVQKCTMILAVGAAPVGALADGHARFPDPTYVAVGGGANRAPAGGKETPITTLTAERSEDIREAVTEIVASLG